MLTPDTLASRVRGEYREMPGLRLTVPQACRLWQVDRVTCEAVLARLVAEQFLLRTPNGAYMSVPVPAMPLKASLTRQTATVRTA